jgi:6,7-dimethyl-8-ribityllumazine synthase
MVFLFTNNNNMATKLKNLSDTNLENSKAFTKTKISLVVAEWNNEITFALRDGAIEFLTKMGVKEKNILISYVPGAYELAFGAQLVALGNKYDAVITVGCIIKGDTPHFDFISDACANGIMQVGLSYGLPVIFGVLTTNDLKQAKERSGGKHGNKGIEAAETALKMIALQSELTK